jgi:hypothetical protein
MEKKKQPDDDEDNLEDSMNRRTNNGNDRDETDENLRNSALVLLEQISKDKSTDPVEAIEGLLKTVQATQNAKQKARLSLVSGVHTEEEEFQTRELLFPIMSLLGLPVTKHSVSSLLREIVALSCLYPEHGLLSYETHRGTSCELVKVTRSKNKDYFVTNVRQHQSWLHCLPTLVVAENVDPSVGARR